MVCTTCVQVICGLFVCAMYTVSAETTSGFPSAEDVRTTPGIVNLSLVRQWLFPSIKFTCNGNVTRWIFRAEAGPGPGSTGGLPELPLMNVWRENFNTPLNPDDYIRVEAGSGSEEELVGDGPVYEYVLQSPVEVQEDDVFGIFLPYAGDERLQLLFSDLGDGGAPTSYRRFVVGAIFDTGNHIHDIDERYIPLVTAVIDIPGGTTSIPLSPSPTQSTGPTAINTSPMAIATPSTSEAPSSIHVPSPSQSSSSPPDGPPVSSSSPPDGQPKDSLPRSIIIITTSFGAALVLMVIIIVAIACIFMVFKRHTKTVEVTANEVYGLQPVVTYSLKDNEAYGVQPQMTDSMQVTHNEAYGLQRRRADSLEDNEAYEYVPTGDETINTHEPMYEEPY